MKLRNKRTGEIMEFDAILPVKDVVGDSVADLDYGSLAELNSEWEDVSEEPKEYWFINDLDGKPMKCELRYCPIRDFAEWRKKRKQIGNYFKTQEETETVVKKLKAWKRLKEAGFEFGGWTHTPITKSLTGYNLHIKAYSDKLADFMDDLQLLFGGEE